MSRKKPIQPQPVATTDAGQQTVDAFSNLMARLGFNSGNLMEGTEYPLTRLTRDYNLMNSLYRSHWIVRKIIDGYPEDMCKNWIQLSCQVTPEQTDVWQKLERKTRTRANIVKALKWGRLYGGAAAVMMIEGHEDILDQPLDLDTVMPGSYKGLLVLDRWSGIYPSSEQITDINDPDFGLPAVYRVTTETGQHFEIHSSRVLRFIGRDLPFWEKQAEVHWGCSEIELIFDELKKRDNTSWNIAALVFLANIRVLKMDKLGQVLGSQNAKAQQNLYNTLQAQNHLMSNMGMMVVDKEDDFDTKSFAFAGLADIAQVQMMDICGAAEYPATKLFGRSPAGLSATGESDLQNYYDNCGEKQETALRPVLEKLLPVMLISCWGEVPDDFDFTFNPVQSTSSNKLAELASKKTTSVIDTFNAGLISQRTSLKELRQMSDETGMWTNITDDDIEAADEEVQQQGELGGMGAMFGEQPGSNRGATEEQPGPKKSETHMMSEEEYAQRYGHPRPVGHLK
jgi:phage-related protein (TIGR01555 family)